MMDPNDIVIIGVDTDDGPSHPLYDARVHRPLNEATVRDMIKRGVKKPILVTKDGKDSPPIVVDGRRRILHAREANRRLEAEGVEVRVKVPVLPPERGDEGRLLGHMIALNEHVEADSPMNRSKKLQHYLDLGYTEQDAAEVFSVSTQTVQNYLKLLSLHPQCQKAIEEDKLSPSAAYQLADLPQAKQRSVLEKALKDQNRATITDIEKALGKRKPRRKNDDEPQEPKGPSKALLRYVVNAGEGRVSKDFRLGIEFARGNLLSLDEVDGLAALVAEMEAAK